LNNAVKYRSSFVLLLLVLIVATGAGGESSSSASDPGSFVTITQADGSQFLAFVAGPADAEFAVLIVHDYFGISDATKQSVNHLGFLGYRSLAVDLYAGKAATSHEDAVKLMQSLDRKATDKVLQAGLDYLKQPGQKVATLGFSMGALESLYANLNDPDAVSSTVMIYGYGFDKIDTKILERLKSPVLVIAGEEDTNATRAAIDFLSNMKQANRPYEMLIYPGADHGYAQPLFNKGKNYNPEAVCTTWMLVEDFLDSHLRR
jgi:carboxymethylenebutenolidase